MTTRTVGWRRRGTWPAAAATIVLLELLFPAPVYAASDINTVIDSIRNWVAGILAGLATLFLTIGGIRYLVASGNPRALEEERRGRLSEKHRQRVQRTPRSAQVRRDS